MVKRAVVIALLIAATEMHAQDIVARARELAVAGDRSAALRLLEERLASTPADNDARTLYGIVLSWEGRYDEARRVLREAVAADPRNTDAREALARVDAWSRAGRGRRAVSAGVNYDDYDDRADWIEPYAAAELPLRAGALVARVSQGRRSPDDDLMGEVEFYPRFGARTYAYLSAGIAAEGSVYPDVRAGAELFHLFGRGIEVSAGARHLAFADAVTVYTGSVGIYRGAWYAAVRGYLTESETTAQFLLRRYISDDNHYFGFRVGFGREEVRSAADLESLDRTEMAAEAHLPVTRRLSLAVRAGGGEGKGTLTLAAAWSF